MFSHHPDDRPWCPARLPLPLEVAARDGPTRRTVASAVPRVVLVSARGVMSSRLGEEGQVRWVRERKRSAPTFGCSSLGTALLRGTATESRYQTFDNPFVPLKKWSVSLRVPVPTTALHLAYRCTNLSGSVRVHVGSPRASKRTKVTSYLKPRITHAHASGPELVARGVTHNRAGAIFFRDRPQNAF